MRHISTYAAVARVLSRRDRVTVRVQGGRAHTDGRTITIPDLGNDLDEDRATLALGYLYHETGHCRYSDFPTWADGSLSPELRNLANLLEDIAVEACMGREYPGCRETLAALNDGVLDMPPHPLSSLLVNGLKLVADQELTLAVDPRLAQDCFGEDIFLCVADACEPRRSTMDRLALARLLLDCLTDRQRLELALMSPQAGDMTGEPQAGDMRAAEWSAGRVLQALREYKDHGERLAEMLTSRHEKALKAGEYLVYSREEDRFEPAPAALSDEPYRRLRERCARLGSRFVRLFRAEHAERWFTGREQGLIDSRVMHRVRTGNFKVFKQKAQGPRVSHNTAVSFLVDCSGSMEGDRMENAMAAVAVFLESLTKADVACEVLGYTTCGEYDVPWELKERYGRVDKLLTVVFKSFAERLSPAVRCRISGYRKLEMHLTCIVDPLLIAYERLMLRSEPRKILFLLTDGGVCSHGNDAAGERELKRVARTIEREGLVELLTIDLMSGDTEGVFSKRIVVEESDDLASALMSGLESHLLGARRGRR